ncbi:Phage protein [Methyloversatilis universalis FAM5]|uniref:Phage protein n=1 Tax=Methyloversatilis universalis (strain ATCC BAA-1314 / DSM 25237 / JCM 13912 / CCUG 52030 / FAM5) TaxID=1000565 RepID=F5RC40_METUF|nr:phage tail assembly chaperone [Methyloversatilis universalis]EGK71903.1 Phage protein [Methyloversatilis universalis FAM5]
MAFKLKPNPTFQAKVKIAVPGQDKPEVITFTFRHKTKVELEALFSEASKQTSDVDLVAEIATNWDVADAPFNREALEELFQNYHGAALAIVDAYHQQLQAARLGN